MDTTDTQSYGQGNNNGIGNALKLIQMKNNLKKMNAAKGSQDMSNSPTPMANPSSPEQGSVPYGQGTNMSLLGAGQPYGGMSTPMPTSGGMSTPVDTAE